MKSKVSSIRLMGASSSYPIRTIAGNNYPIKTMGK